VKLDRTVTQYVFLNTDKYFKIGYFNVVIFFFFLYDSPFNSEGALERAKRSVEQQYAVVGVLEDFNVTLTVFEHYIPRFFKGASEVYYGNLY